MIALNIAEVIKNHKNLKNKPILKTQTLYLHKIF
jgi:hypothetical protein